MVNATVCVDGDVLVLTIGSEPLARRLPEQRNTDASPTPCTPCSECAGGCAATTATPHRRCATCSDPFLDAAAAAVPSGAVASCCPSPPGS